MKTRINTQNPNCLVCGGMKMVSVKHLCPGQPTNFHTDSYLYRACDVFLTPEEQLSKVGVFTEIEVYCSNCGIVYKTQSVLS